MAMHSFPAASARQPEPRLLGSEHDRVLQEAAADRERARGELLAMLFMLPGKAWSLIRDRAVASRHRSKPVTGAR